MHLLIINLEDEGECVRLSVSTTSPNKGVGILIQNQDKYNFKGYWNN